MYYRLVSLSLEKCIIVVRKDKRRIVERKQTRCIVSEGSPPAADMQYGECVDAAHR